MQRERKKVIFLGYVALVLCVLAVSASFAWMSISSTPTVTDLALSVVSDNRLEVAPDNEGKPGVWGSILGLTEESELAAPLKPVTFKAEDNSFYEPGYGLDGRVDFSNAARLTDENGKLLVGKDSAPVYSCDFWIRSSASYCSVGLTPAVVRENGELGNGTFVIGEPVWNEKTFRHDEAGNGTEKAVRVALRIEGNGAEPACWVIYEPCADENSQTAGVSGSPLQGNNRLIRQKTSEWTESSPILKDTVIYKPGDFIDNVDGLFDLEPGISKHVTLYLWIEGQDPDCTNAISGGRIFANLQFNGELNNPAGLKPE